MIAGMALALAAAAMQLSSGDFVAGGAIPKALMSTDCAGQNRTPSLLWTNPPKSTKSFALIEHDADAPIAGGFYHWVIYDIPATTRALAANAPLAEKQIGVASTGRAAYYGPCPPPGPPHHYTFTLYALDIAEVSAGASLTGPQLEKRIAGHVLTRATLAGTAIRP